MRPAFLEQQAVARTGQQASEAEDKLKIVLAGQSVELEAMPDRDRDVSESEGGWGQEEEDEKQVTAYLKRIEMDAKAVKEQAGEKLRRLEKNNGDNKGTACKSDESGKLEANPPRTAEERRAVPVTHGPSPTTRATMLGALERMECSLVTKVCSAGLGMVDGPAEGHLLWEARKC